MVNDSIADFLTRVRNAIARKKEQVVVPSNKMVVAIASILKNEGFINDYKEETQDNLKVLVISLKYINGESAIRKLTRVSKPGVRKYMGYRNIPRVMQGLGVAIFSTPKGVMSGNEAKKNSIGGEYLCSVW